MPSSLNSVEAVYHAVRQATPAGVHDAPAPIPAAAVVLWRPGPTGDAEVYLVRRSPSLAFLGSFWAFPGGRLEDGDTADAVVGGDGDTARALAAGVREVREELGIELPRDATRYLHGGRWITPPPSPIRFDATYFLFRADAIPEPRPQASDGELVAGAWVTAREVTQRWQTGEWMVPSPILRVVHAIGARWRDEGELRAALADAARAEEVAPRLWPLVGAAAIAPLRTPTLPPATHTNACVLGTDEVVIVDPATPHDDELAELDRILDQLTREGRVVREVLLTHHHTDHVGAAHHVAERMKVGIAAHAITADLLADRVEVARTVDDGEIWHLGGEPASRVQAVFTAGHAPGHLCFFDHASQILAAGDMVAGVGTILIDPSEGDMAQYLASLHRLRTLPVRAILPAHGQTITDPAARLDEYIAHRLWREQQVLGAFDGAGSASVAELVARAYRDVPAAVHPLAARSLIAHLVKLEGESRVSRRGDRWARAE